MSIANMFGPTLALAGLVAVLYLATNFARKRLGIGAGTISTEALRVVGKRTLEPRKSLYVVEIADRYVLVGASEDGLSLIDRISAEEFQQMVPRDELDSALDESPEASLDDTSADRPVVGDDADELAARIRDAGRSATLGEGFQYLMSKARRSKTARERVAAGVAAAASDDSEPDQTYDES